MQIAAGHNVTPTRSQLVAASVALMLMVGVAGGMLIATWTDRTGLMGLTENSLPENTRPMILVPLPR
jgi:hypothetical protein